jgi:predicted TIM-barrel fold metal-dependent hydrolase
MIIDSLIHPTLDGRWTKDRAGLGFDGVDALLRSGNIAGACAVGLPRVGGYGHEAFMQSALRVDGLQPVAALTNPNAAGWRQELAQVSDLGYRAVKFHPRLLGLNNEPGAIEEFLPEASRADLIVFYCTYSAASAAALPTSDPLWALVRAIRQTPTARLVLVHGGVHRLLEYSEMFRHCPNVLIDLSFTMMTLRDSPVQTSIRHALRTLDQRLCIGSDAPDLDFGDWVSQTKLLATEVDANRWANISGANIARWMWD